MACSDARAAVVLAALLLAGCATPPVDPWAGRPPPLAPTAVAGAGIRDLRAEYRAALCPRLPAGTDCDAIVLRLPDEAAAIVPAATVDNLPQRYRIGLLPGLFAECLQDLARPFADAEPALRAEGFAVDYLLSPGRGTAAANAEWLAAHYRAQDEAAAADPRPYIVFAYSKGLVDVLEFLVRYPQQATRIAAVVGIAGAANGSPLAEQLQSVYRDWVAALPLPHCDHGNGGEIDDLRPELRAAWWRRHGAELTVPLFSLVTAPRPERVSPVLRPAYDRLAQIDPRNDGKLLSVDQLMPGGRLLGFVNADHWAVVVPLSDELPPFAFLFDDRVPRAALVRSAIDVVAADLAKPK